jgi:hypothetical protein
MAQFTSDDVDHTFTVPGFNCSYAPLPWKHICRPATRPRPYFFWDDGISEGQVCDLVRNGSPTEKAGVVGRIIALLLIK